MVQLDTEDSLEATNYTVYFYRYCNEAVAHLYKMAREFLLQK